MLKEMGLSLLRSKSPYGEPLENHCLRLAEFSLALGQARGVPLDEDLTYAACYLHDIGLCVANPDEKNYLKRGHVFTVEHTASWGLTEAQADVLADVMLYSHSMKPVPGISPAGEMVRLAVSVEHSLGRVNQGLDRSFCREVFAKYPRKGFNRVLLGFFKTAVVEDGAGRLPEIFFPTRNQI
jgi:hypothetical protein